MTIGFSNGDFYRLYKNDLERFSKEYLAIFLANNLASAIELNCPSESHLDYLLSSDEIALSNFKYISLHAPDMVYQKDEPSQRILSKLSLIVKKHNIKNIVFHTDKVEDWDIFLDYSMLPISIENMDRNKEFGKNIEDIKSIIERYNFNLTVDLQHFFTNDPSMESAINFQKIYKKNIVVYHLSGYDKKFLHYPLFKTGQNEIIKSVMHKEIPIIIESTFDKLGEETKELNHIMGLI